MSNLEGKLAVVTGASRGIGRSIALGLGTSGAVVIGTATSKSGVDCIIESFQKNNIQGSGMVLNVSKSEDCIKIIKTVTTKFGAPQILVNNAGITRDNIIMRMKNEEWDDVISTNMSAIFHMSKAVLRGMMKAHWGRIINISSVVSSMGNAGQSNYAAAKAGLEGFSRSLAKEIGSYQISVNTIAPGFIDTDMTKKLINKERNLLKAQVPMTRFGQPEEIAGVVIFLASEVAGYITGETIHVNGGMYMS